MSNFFIVHLVQCDPEKVCMFILTYFQIARTSANLRHDGLLNHISSIFSGQPVQGVPVCAAGVDVGGDVVEVATEVRLGDLLHCDPVHVREDLTLHTLAGPVQVEVDVPARQDVNQLQEVHCLDVGLGLQLARGLRHEVPRQGPARVDHGKSSGSGSGFQRLLVTKPSACFSVISTQKTGLLQALISRKVWLRLLRHLLLLLRQ